MIQNHDIQLWFEPFRDNLSSAVTALNLKKLFDG